MWFVDDPENTGYNEFPDEQEALAMFEGCLEFWEEAAEADGEWCDSCVTRLRFGKVLKKIELENVGTDESPNWQAKTIAV